MANLGNLLIVVNTGADKPNNQYAAYVTAFMAKKIAKLDNVTIFYGPQGVGMARKGELAKLAITADVKRLIADQLEGVSPSDFPDDLGSLARLVKEQLGVNILSCGTFHVIDGFANTVDDASQIEDFITPVRITQAAEASVAADKIVYY